MKDALLALTARGLFLAHGIIAVWKCQSTYKTNTMYVLLGPVLMLFGEGSVHKLKCINISFQEELAYLHYTIIFNESIIVKCASLRPMERDIHETVESEGKYCDFI